MAKNIISQITLPNGATYDIYDASAIHDVSELGIGDVMRFKGIKQSYDELMAEAPAKAGDVWIVSSSGGIDGVDFKDREYICVQDINTPTDNAWEELGNVIDASSSTHTHTVTVNGTNRSSKVTGSATVTIPTVSKTTKYLSATATQGAVTPSKDEVLGAGTKFTVSGGTAGTARIKATASGAAVGAKSTAKAITALGTPTTAAAITELATEKINLPTATPVSIPNVTKNITVTASKVSTAGTSTNGTAASWNASVNGGVLSFNWTANTPTTVTLPTFADVTATNTTLGTELNVSSVAFPEDNQVTVVTGSKTTANAITGFGAHTTANALTDVEMTAQPTVKLSEDSDNGDIEVVVDVSAVTVAADSSDRVNAVTGVNVAAPTITINDGATSGVGVDIITIGSETATVDHDLTAAAQQWTQGTTTVSMPVDNN